MTKFAEDRSDLARLRTEYAEDRTVLANERTYTAWIRTGLTALAAGLAFERFLVGLMLPWRIRSIAAVLILFSAVAFFLAGWRYTHLGVKLARAEVRRVLSAVTSLTSAFLVACSITALIGLWLVGSNNGP